MHCNNRYFEADDSVLSPFEPPLLHLLLTSDCQNLMKKQQYRVKVRRSYIFDLKWFFWLAASGYPYEDEYWKAYFGFALVCEIGHASMTLQSVCRMSRIVALEIWRTEIEHMEVKLTGYGTWWGSFTTRKTMVENLGVIIERVPSHAFEMLGEHANFKEGLLRRLSPTQSLDDWDLKREGPGGGVSSGRRLLGKLILALAGKIWSF